jgi:hypothetical protein
MKNVEESPQFMVRPGVDKAFFPAQHFCVAQPYGDQGADVNQDQYDPKFE